MVLAIFITSLIDERQKQDTST